MAKNFVQPGDALELTAPGGGVVAGSPYLIGKLFGVALVTAAVGVRFNMSIEGVWTLPKTAGVAWTEGQRLYWNAGTSKLSTVGTDGQFVGIATAAAAGGDLVGNVLLKGEGVADGDQGPQAAIVDFAAPTDTPASADALRDDITAIWLPKLNAILAALRARAIIS